MKFTCSTEINLPVREVFELFVNKNNLKEWQKDLVSYEPVSGTPGEVGAITKQKYKSVTLFETITSKNTPFAINGTYEHKRGEKTVMIHKASNRFSSSAENKTLYEMEMETVKFVGFLPKLMMTLMGGTVKKYYQKWLDRFKAFAEREGPSIRS